MHEIDTDGHVSNQFDEGDPGVPRQPTQVDKHWLNAVQNELVNAIEADGQALVKGTWTQLKRAMGFIVGTPGAAARYFSGLLSVAVTAGTAISGSTGSAVAGDAGVDGYSELTTGVEGGTADGIAGQFNVSGTGKAIEANGPVDINGAANISGVLSLGTFSVDGSFPGSPAAGDIVYLGGANDKLYCYDGTTWQAFW